MSLLRLPPQTLVQIMNHVGSSYFREDLARLPVCRQWLNFACIVCFKDIRLSQQTLQRLFRPWDEGRSLLPIKDNLENLGLELKGFDSWATVPESQSALRGAIIWSLGRTTLADWTTSLDNDLTQLASLAQAYKPQPKTFLSFLILAAALIFHFPQYEHCCP